MTTKNFAFYNNLALSGNSELSVYIDIFRVIVCIVLFDEVGVPLGMGEGFVGV